MIKSSAIQCEKEEFANTLSHGLGLVLSIIGSAVISYFAIVKGDSTTILATSVFSITMIILYASSTFYHSAKCEKKKELLNIIDHSAIYLFIAGSYTLVLLTLMDGPQAKLILTLQWATALAGTIYKFKKGANANLVDCLVYMFMGWMIVLFYEQLQMLPQLAFNLILAGGICYSIGVLFFLMDHKIRYFHTIWHFFVIAGTVFHYLVGAFYI